MNTFLSFLCGILLAFIIILLFGVFANFNESVWNIWDSVFNIEKPN